MQNRGSEWRKWDLHLHSPYTFLNKYTSTDEDFITKIVHENISCIGLTNYFRFDDREYELKEKLESRGIITFLNLELRLDYQNKEADCIDLHVIFSNEIKKENLQRFLMNMKVNINGSNKKLIDIHSPDDFDKAVVSFDDLLDCLNEESNGLHEKFLIGFLSRGKGTARTSSNYEKICKKSDLIIHSTDSIKNIEDDRKFWLSHKMPLLQNSDAHSLDHIGKKFTWIKAQPTFEGLKQIIYEPEERVRIQKEMPESEKLETLMIKKVVFTSSKSRFTPEPIYFNKNLNVIIGGKSSGKSILLYEIAKTLYSDPFDKVLRYKDVEDAQEKDLYELNTDDANHNFCLELYSGSSQSKNDRQTQSSILPSIKYIPQNHLSNLVDRSRKNGNTLKKLIRGLILEEPEYQLKYDEFVSQAKRNDNQRNQDIEYYYSLKNELDKKEKELLTKGDTKALEEGIAFSKQKIDELNRDFTTDELTEYNELIENSNNLVIEENQINLDFEKLNNYLSNLKSSLIELRSKKVIVLDSIQNADIKVAYSDKLQFVDDALSSINEIATQFTKDEDKFATGSVFAAEVAKIAKEKGEVEAKLKPFNDKIENQNQVAALQKSISEDETKTSEIKQFEKEIETNKSAIKSQKEKIFRDFAENFKLYEKIIKDLKRRISDIEGETNKIEILPTIKYNFPKFRRLADSIFDGRGFNNHDFDYLYQYWDKNPKSALAQVEYQQIENSIKVVFEKIEKKILLPKGGNTEKDAVKKIFTDFFFDHWDVKSQGDDIHEMSTGKASFVLLQLMIKLSREKGPILIDQPEDNLDNRSVSKELVDFLKDKKKERQIILVTHNPNIVVNGDAENIIVANQKGQNDIESTSLYKFDYINGALENSSPKNNNTDLLKSMGIREHIADIVEGGEIAFKKREKKYGFK
ncbi:TrlF family AAA-like ATPase [Flavobacterium sp. RHBU_24]|uniref:TrlF family AAA-like ATPase n=1 Tax=Flavobacterium sp. RHBU_24 TaxID=3391185 RepID=UPI00398513D1